MGIGKVKEHGDWEGVSGGPTCMLLGDGGGSRWMQIESRIGMMQSSNLTSGVSIGLCCRFRVDIFRHRRRELTFS
jgi:hypothetical protein